MARSSHITIAQTQGPKAGFNAYIESLEGSGLPTTKAALAAIKSQGNKKAQFDFYCAKFGNKFGTTGVSDLHEAPAQASNEALAALRAEMARLQALVDAVASSAVEDEDTSLDEVPDVLPAQVTAPAATRKTRSSSKTTSATSKTNKPAFFRAWAIAKFGIPTEVGATFTYKGKRRSTKMIVTAVAPDGVTAIRI